MKRLTVFFALCGLAVVGYAMAQQLTSNQLTGNEVLTGAIGGPGGTAIFIPVSQLRNVQGQQSVGSPGPVTVNTTLGGTSVLFINTVTGAVTLNTPATPWEGQIFEVMNGSAAPNTATITVTALAGSGQTVNAGAVATLAANSAAEWRYVQVTNTWYRVR